MLYQKERERDEVEFVQVGSLGMTHPARNSRNCPNDYTGHTSKQTRMRVVSSQTCDERAAGLTERINE